MTLFGAFLLTLLMPSQAFAHGGLPGGGGFYSGAAHPVWAIEQFLALSSFGLLLGQQPGVFQRSPIAALAVGLVAGLASGLLSGFDGLALATLALALLFGCALAAALPLPGWVLWGAAVVTGWTIAADTDLPRPASGAIMEVAAPYAGIAVGVLLIVLNAAALGSLARRPPFAVVLRIAGSWVAAIGLMVLALRVRGLMAV